MENLRKTYSIEVVCENRSQVTYFDSLMKDVAQAIFEVLREELSDEERPVRFCMRSNRTEKFNPDVLPF